MVALVHQVRIQLPVDVASKVALVVRERRRRVGIGVVNRSALLHGRLVGEHTASEGDHKQNGQGVLHLSDNCFERS